jgi:hypothetical protein
MQVEADPDTMDAVLLLAFGAEAIAANAGNPSALAVSTTLSQGVGIGNSWAGISLGVYIALGARLTAAPCGSSTPCLIVLMGLPPAGYL